MRVLNKQTLALHTTSMILVLLFIAGCAAPAGHAALDQAGAAVERARGAPRVRALAAAELERAETALEHARAAARAGAPPDQVEHLAYIVSRRAALAEARAGERVARSELTKMQRALDQVVAHGPHHQDQRISASREPDRQARAWVQQDRQARAPLEQDRREAAAVQENRPAPAPLEEGRREGAAVREDRQARTPLEEGRREGAAVREDRQARAPLEGDQWERAAVREDRQAPPLLERDRRERASMQEDRQARAPLEQGARERAWVQEHRQARAPLEQDQRAPAAVQEDRQAPPLLERDRGEGAPVQEHRQAHMAAQDAVAAIVETVPQDITLSLARLPFDGAEPTSATLEELAAVAERLLREPGSSVVIEAVFALSEPEARTVMERRVEVVRAILLRRGVEPARLVVRAAGDGPLAPPATSRFVESPD